MMFLGVLCLAVGVIANPALWVAREAIDPLAWPLGPLTIVEAEEKVPGIPLAPTLDPLPLVTAVEIKTETEEAKEEKEEAEKPEEEEMEKDEEVEGEKELEKESEKEDERTDEEKEKDFENKKEPVIVNLDVPNIPEFITNFWNNLPNYLPHITWPPIFTRPLAPVPAPTPDAGLARYRLAYDPYLASYVRIIEKK